MKLPLILWSFIILIISGCQKETYVSERYQLIDKKNAVIVDNQEYWNEIKDVQIQMKDCKMMKLQFWNNPYSLGRNDKISISLNIDNNIGIIYKGEYKQAIDVCIPNAGINKISFPGFTIFRDSKTYHLMQKMHVDIKNTDEYLYIVFMPDRGVVGGCQMISSDKRFD